MTTCKPDDGRGAEALAAYASLSNQARAARRLGLFGGSFDPVHQGHLDVGKAAREALGLDHVVFVPAALSPHKTGLPPEPGSARVELLRRALGSVETASWASIWTVELLRRPPSYTVLTLDDLGAARPGAGQPWLILGEDNLAGLPSWRRVGELLERSRPIVVQRSPGTDLVAAVEALELDPQAVSRLLEGMVPLELPSPYSSTAVREALELGRDPGSALPPGVWDAIVELGLYGQARGR
ncbi:nicotinate-nicotinamide nucleotide adenylyltransferase [Engelhardtia mirabilis]|uniref:Probable nicotinate-nucleotide adenylyltransferase n=1 Tax=Engelhardtia mirabilis TaxID=2528011 RepID=A0A518BJB5_9BACT|nr:Nicotinate-nucleotide adenylyltransferase [Planctomycetes bacterium Pla133]QDV01385.1 Nicotinate-nucleotide adenylyltransferase [Planctomycetes bacterium Pla86]